MRNWDCSDAHQCLFFSHVASVRQSDLWNVMTMLHFGCSGQGSGREVVRGSASCGYGPIGPESWPAVAVGQISSINSLQPNPCGVCLEVSPAVIRGLLCLLPSAVQGDARARRYCLP